MLDLTDWQNKKYTTKEGKPVRILCIDAPRSWPIIGLEGGSIRRWSKDGISDASGCPSQYDLINAKTKREGWINIFQNASNEREPGEPVAYATHVYETENEAVKWGRVGIPSIKIEWEE